MISSIGLSCNDVLQHPRNDLEVLSSDSSTSYQPITFLPITATKDLDIISITSTTFEEFLASPQNKDRSPTHYSLTETKRVSQEIAKVLRIPRNDIPDEPVAIRLERAPPLRSTLRGLAGRFQTEQRLRIRHFIRTSFRERRGGFLSLEAVLKRYRIYLRQIGTSKRICLGGTDKSIFCRLFDDEIVRRFGNVNIFIRGKARYYQGIGK